MFFFFFLVTPVAEFGKPRRVASFIHLFPKSIVSMATCWVLGYSGGQSRGGPRTWQPVLLSTLSLSLLLSHRQEITATSNAPTVLPWILSWAPPCSPQGQQRRPLPLALRFLGGILRGSGKGGSQQDPPETMGDFVASARAAPRIAVCSAPSRAGAG